MMGINIAYFIIGSICGTIITFVFLNKRNKNIKPVIKYKYVERPVEKSEYEKKEEFAKEYEKKAKPASDFKAEKPENNQKTPADDLTWQTIKICKRKSAFDSKAEQIMYNFLRSELGGAVRVDFHVHMNELFRVSDDENTYYNKLWACHIDFVIRDRKNPAIIYFAVELDGHESHRTREETIINDKFKTRIFGENNIPVLRLGGDVNPYFVAFQPETYPPELVSALKYTKDKIKELNTRKY